MTSATLMKRVCAFIFLVCFALNAVSAAPVLPRRRLLTVTKAQICSKPQSQDTASTLAQAVVSGNAFGGADASAIIEAGSQCCNALKRALVKAQSYAVSIGQGAAFTSASGTAATTTNFPTCAKDAFASVTTLTQAGPGFAQGVSSSQARGSRAASASSSTSASSGPNGSSATATGDANGNRRRLLTVSKDTICTAPTSQETAKTLAEAVVSGNAIGGAEASAVIDAANQCCDQFKQALASAKSYAESSGQGQAFTQAAATARFNNALPSCAKEAFASTFTETQTGPGSASSRTGGSASGTTSAFSGSSSFASVGREGSTATGQSNAGANGRKRRLAV